MANLTRTVLALLFLIATPAISFTIEVSTRRPATALRDWGGAGPSKVAKGSAGSIEQIEFKIFPDGRVQETVRGVKGGHCHSVTEKINEQLGKVVNSAPTEEMFEQEVTVDQTLTQTEGTSWDGSTPSSW